MFSFLEIAIRGYQNRPVPNTFLRQDGESSHLAILFPGYAYRADMPLFYYPTVMLIEAGTDVLVLEPDYFKQPGYRQEWLAADAVESFREGAKQRPYQTLTLIGKSLGTLSIAHLLETASPENPRCIWLTPLLGDETVKRRLLDAENESLCVIGTKDRFYDEGLLAEIGSRANVRNLIVPNADHDLELPGDMEGSLHILLEVMKGIRSFLFDKD
jgi:hypothetical protein